MAACKTTVLCRVRRALLVLSCAALPLVCSAARRVPVYVVDVGGQSPPALQQAMRAALVRATGRAESATDPVFATLVAQAPKYVLGYQHGRQGRMQVAFNGAAVDQVIASLGRSVWDADRPFTLIVFSPAPSQDDYGADHDALEQAAEARGLPISIVPLPVTDAGGHLLPQEALLALVHRFGAQQLLVGRPPAAGSTGSVAPPAQAPAAGAIPTPAVPAPFPAATGTTNGTAAGTPAVNQWQWTLITPFMSRVFTGSLTTGIDGTVDLLVPPPTSAADQVSEARVRIEGVSTLDDYARIERMLAAMPGVSRAGVNAVHGDSAVFDLQVRGGDAAVGRLLSGSPHFTPIQAAGGDLIYRFVPGPAATPPAAEP